MIFVVVGFIIMPPPIQVKVMATKGPGRDNIEIISYINLSADTKCGELWVKRRNRDTFTGQGDLIVTSSFSLDLS